MKYKGSLVAFVLLYTAALPAQTISLDRQVIGCFGLSGGDMAHFSMTAGEAVTPTFSTPNFDLTQGFHQPADVEPEELEVLWSISFDECESLYEITLSTISGCDAENGFSILWQGIPGDSSYSFAETELVFSILTSNCETEFTLDMTTENIEYLACPLLFYSLVTPNGDGANDSWIIENISFHTDGKNRVEIFNRWGEKIWSGAGYDNHNVVWTGNSDDGKPLPDGTYFYSVFTDARSYKGYVELHR
jgi:gliding motility-associated-like protein